MRGKVAREAVADMKASKEAETSAPAAEAPAAEEEEEMPSGEDAEAAAAKLQARMRGKVAREAVADMKASKEANGMARPGSAPRFAPSASLKYLGERIVVNVNFDGVSKVARVETLQPQNEARNEFSYDHSDLLKLLNEDDDQDLIAALEGDVSDHLPSAERDRLVAKLLEQVPIRLDKSKGGESKDSSMPSQAELVNRFVPGLQVANSIWKKIAGVNARTYEEEESSTVETVTASGAETKNTVRKGDIIVINPGGERYVLTADAFRVRYFSEAGSEPKPTDRDQDVALLKEQGFSFYEAQGKVYRHIVTKEDISTSFPSNKMTTVWGEMQIDEGDSLCAPFPDASEVYRVAADVFEDTYVLADSE